MARLQQAYREKVVPDLMKRFGYSSVMEVPRITKITLNMGVGEAVADRKIMDNAMGDMVTALNLPEQELMNWVKTQQPNSAPSYSVLGTILREYDLVPDPGYRLRIHERLSLSPAGLSLTPRPRRPSGPA